MAGPDTRDAHLKALVIGGAVIASLAVCIVSALLLLRSPRSAGVPEIVRPLPTFSLPRPAPPLAENSAEAPEVGSRQLQLEIERSLLAVDDSQRERTYLQLVPALITIDPTAMKLLVERFPAGPVREELLRHTARAWSSADLSGAIEWATTMNDDGDRVMAATEIASQVGQADPAQAIEVSDLFGIGRNDGTVEHIAQLWATENLAQSLTWIESQPPGAPRDQLLARITGVQAETAPADAANTALRQISPGPIQEDAVVAVVGRWSAQDADAASEWVEDLPQGRLREIAKAEVKRVMTPISPATPRGTGENL